MNFKNSMLCLIAFGNALFLGAGCSAIKDMDNMKDTTQQVSNTSDKIAGTSDDMDNKMNDQLELSDQLYMKLRQGNSLQARQDSLKQMNSAKTMKAKIAAAGSYFQAFEFQLWGNIKGDNRDGLEDLYLCAMQEFTRDAGEYIPDNYKMDPTSKNNQMMNLYAISVTMHEINKLAVPQPIDLGKPAVSISLFDLLKRALLLKKDLESGAVQEASLDDWQREALSAERDLDYLIQTRENFLPVMTLANVSDIANAGFLGLRGLFLELKMMFTQWDPSITGSNIEQIMTDSSWLKEAVADRDFLDSINSNSKMNSSILKIYKNMKFPESPSNAVEPEADALNDLKNQIEELKKTSSD